MKTKAMVISCLMIAVVLFICFGPTQGEPKEEKTAVKIGVVNIRKVFRDCKRNASYRADALSEQARWEAEEKKLQNEIETQKIGIRALKSGSSDYLAQVKEVLEKQAQLEASRQFNSQQRMAKDQQWTENLYKEVLQITRELAEAKGFDLVLEKGEVEFPAMSTDELMLTLSTHKLLYSDGCPDITDDVTNKLDAK